MANSWFSPPPIHRFALDNGLVCLTVENTTADIVAARIFIQAGHYHDPPGLEGCSAMVSALLTKGTTTASTHEIALTVEAAGASLGTDSAPDYFLVTLKTVSEDFSTILRLAADLIQRPTFPQAELELERRLTLQGIRNRREQPLSLALQQLRRSLYGSHPYHQTGAGTEASVKSLTRADLCQFHQQWFNPAQTIVSIAGNISAKAAQAEVHNAFGDWQNPQVLPTLPQHLSPQPTPEILHQNCATQQSILMLGYLAPDVNSHHYPALKLLSTYLCNGLTSRLFIELRERRGLAYEVSGFYPTRRDPSHFVVYLGTAPERATTALQLMQHELEQLSQDPLSEQEFQLACSKLLGQYALGQQTNQQLAHLYGWYEHLGLGINYEQTFVEQIQAVTPAQALQTAREVLARPTISTIGPRNPIQN